MKPRINFSPKDVLTIIFVFSSFITLFCFSTLTHAHAQTQVADRREASFQLADANHDGRVSREEFESFAKSKIESSGGMRAAMFSRLSAQDQNSRIDSKFSAMDNGAKGYLTIDDWHKQD